MKRHPSVISSAVIVTIILGSIESTFAITFVGSPADAWSYSRLPGAVGDLNYFPTDTSEFESATFVDYVSYTNTSNGWFQLLTASTGFHVFSTWVTSEFDQSMFFINGGDDGHSVFVDGNFIGGAGFGVNVTGNISLEADVPRNLTIVTHNAGGEMHANFFTQPAQDRTLEETPGISINAVLIPEPGTAVLMAICFASLFSFRRGRKNRCNSKASLHNLRPSRTPIFEMTD